MTVTLVPLAADYSEQAQVTNWPARIARGGQVLAPGEPTDPVQFIDARDLMEWTIRMIEAKETGVFNATGPEKPLSMGEMLSNVEPSRLSTHSPPM